MAQDITPNETRIGWIGTGVMGLSMCANLMNAGYRATVFSRTRSRSQPLIDKGAVWADSPKAVAEASDVIFSIVGTPDDVRQVTLADDGVLAGCGGGEVIVDMTTSQPALAVEIAEAAAAKGVSSIDAPVSGGDVGARDGKLSIMIGGAADAVTRLDPLWQIMGATIVRQGGPGAGQHTKMVNQTIIAPLMIGICEGMLYAQQAGLDPEVVLQSVGSGAAGSWSLSNLAPRMIAGNFAPGFAIEHFNKDMDIALSEAVAMDLDLPGLALTRELYQRLADDGHDPSGTQALVLEMARHNSIRWAGEPDGDVG